MANITKKQIKSRINKIKELIENARLELDELKDDVEYEIDCIEPYDGKDDLTPQQEERQEWLEDTHSTLDDQVYSLEEIISYLEEIE